MPGSKGFLWSDNFFSGAGRDRNIKRKGKRNFYGLIFFLHIKTMFLNCLWNRRRWCCSMEMIRCNYCGVSGTIRLTWILDYLLQIFEDSLDNLWQFIQKVYWRYAVFCSFMIFYGLCSYKSHLFDKDAHQWGRKDCLYPGHLIISSTVPPNSYLLR